MVNRTLELETFSESEKMRSISADLKTASSMGAFEHVIPFAKLGDLDDSIRVFRLLTRTGFHVGSHDDGMHVKWTKKKDPTAVTVES